MGSTVEITSFLVQINYCLGIREVSLVAPLLMLSALLRLMLALDRVLLCIRRHAGPWKGCICLLVSTVPDILDIQRGNQPAHSRLLGL